MLATLLVLTLAHADPAPAAEPPAPSPPATTTEPAAAAPSPPATTTEPAAVAPPPATTTPPAAPPPAPDTGASEQLTTVRRKGDPIPFTRREPTLRGGEVMLGVRYGLVGTGPTRFVDDIRLGLTDWFELRTALLPYPSSLMGRVRLGAQQSGIGAFIIDAGLAHFDAGFRLVPDTGEADVGLRFHWEAGVGYAKALGNRFSLHAATHYRYRMSFLPKDDQHAVAVDARLAYDILDALAVSGGVGFASVIGTPVREVALNFVETDGQGISHLLARDDEIEQSVTLPLALTYGRVDNFDVDLFCTPRVFPEWGILFGAGVRLRFGPLF